LAGRSHNPNDLARLPSVQKVLERLTQSELQIKPEIMTMLVRQAIADLRSAIREGKLNLSPECDLIDFMAEKVTTRIDTLTGGRLKKVINATGIVMHTGLGRAPFGQIMSQYLGELLNGYVNLEFDLESGERGERLDLVNEQLQLLTGAESSAIVNNNAAAVLLALNALAEGQEVLVSRGELIEIGGSFRLPDIMQKSGAKMVEVGTTNRTHLADYQKAFTRRTGAVLLAHSSNYKIEGFTTKPEAEELIAWAHSKRLPVIYDLGSGALVPMNAAGLPYEPVVPEIIRQGFDVITFSGDKLLGGPQAGLIVGKTNYIERIRKNPLMRVLRCDKTVFALLQYTLGQYLLDREIPDIETYRCLTVSSALLRERAESIIKSVTPEIVQMLNLAVCESMVEAGSGAMPTAKIPSIALVAKPRCISENQLARLFRLYCTPIIGYCKDGGFWLDLKAVLPADLPVIQTAIHAIGNSLISNT
jgi:L-seryl-tRNA(Ser) seleniumtransferase